MEALIRDFSRCPLLLLVLPERTKPSLTKEWKRRRFEVSALCLSVGSSVVGP